MTRLIPLRLALGLALLTFALGYWAGKEFSLDLPMLKLAVLHIQATPEQVMKPRPH